MSRSIGPDLTSPPATSALMSEREFKRDVVSRRAMRNAGIIAALAVLAAGGYVVADAHDLVPGVITLAAPPPTAAPFPTIAEPGPADMPAQVLQALPDGAAPPSADDAAQVASIVQRVTTDSRLGPHVGVIVVDVASGTVLAEANPDNTFSPASTQKTLTALAVASELDPNVTLDTRVLLDGNRLVLVGGGDMLLAAGHGDPNTVLGRAGLADLTDQTVAALQAAGINSVELAFDDTLFADPRVAPAVPSADVAAGFIANVSSMAINLARLTPATISPTSPDPALATAQEFARQLTEAGITVTGPLAGTVGPDAVEVGRIQSAPLRDVVEWAMLRSENTITELLGRLVAIERGVTPDAAGAIQAVTTVNQELGVDLAGSNLLDLSGLSRNQAMTPRQLLNSILVPLGNPALRSVTAHLPVANLSGTLATRYEGANPARGVARAKTGSLPGVTALSGTVVTADDRLLAFVIVADQTPGGGQWAPRVAMDNFVGELAAVGG